MGFFSAVPKRYNRDYEVGYLAFFVPYIHFFLINYSFLVQMIGTISETILSLHHSDLDKTVDHGVQWERARNLS